MEGNNYLDVLGTEIKRGDFVAVGTRSGNSGDIHVAIVLDVLTKEGRWGGTQHMVRVKGASVGRVSGEVNLNARYGDTYPDRVVVITKAVPADVRRVLNKAYKDYWK